MSERRVYTLEYKLEAVKLIVEKGLSARQVSEQLGVEVSNIRRWLKKYRHQPLDDVQAQSAEIKEIKRLQDQVRQLKIERDILKKPRPSLQKGNCWDNAVMESFYRSLKAECVSWKKYVCQLEVRSSLNNWIEQYYKRIRRHSTIGYVSPVDFEIAS